MSRAAFDSVFQTTWSWLLYISSDFISIFDMESSSSFETQPLRKLSETLENRHSTQFAVTGIVSSQI